MSEQWTKARDAAASLYTKDVFDEYEIVMVIALAERDFKAGADWAREQCLKDLGPVLKLLKRIDDQQGGDVEMSFWARDALKILDALGVKP